MTEFPAVAIRPLHKQSRKLCPMHFTPQRSIEAVERHIDGRRSSLLDAPQITEKYRRRVKLRGKQRDDIWKLGLDCGHPVWGALPWRMDSSKGFQSRQRCPQSRSYHC